jgi:hypothetical protein
VFGRASRWPYYLRYFDPISLLRNAREVAAKRANEIPLDPLVFTAYGDGPLDTAESRELTYGAMATLDDSCFGALHSLALRLRDSSRAFTVVTTPLNPSWKSRYDAAGSVASEYEAGLAHALDDTGAVLWNAAEETHFESAAFTDAIHLRWSAAHAFSEQIVHRLAPRTTVLVR